MAKQPALGRGLDALMPANAVKISQSKDSLVQEIPISKIKPNPSQPRTEFNDEALSELSVSISRLGLIQPITVREMDDGYMIISGERRYRASKMAGLKTLPAYVRKADDAQMLEMALVENIQREDLNAMEIAQSYQRLLSELALSQEELADRVGKKRSTVTNYLRLLQLGPEGQVAVIAGTISMGHARALLALSDLQEQNYALEQVLTQQLSVRATEELVARIKEPKTQTTYKKNPYRKLAKQLSAAIGLKVKVTEGRVAIAFKDETELEKIKELLSK